MFRRLCWVMLAVCLTGCAESSDGDSAEAVHWAEQVCQSVAGGADKLAEPPRMDPANLAGARDGMVGYLDLLVSAMHAIDDTTSAITETRTRLRDAPVIDPVRFQQALSDIGKNMTQLRNVEGPVKDLTANPDLNKAFSRAASCRGVA